MVKYKMKEKENQTRQKAKNEVKSIGGADVTAEKTQICSMCGANLPKHEVFCTWNKQIKQTKQARMK